MTISVDTNIMRNNPDSYLASQPRMSTSLAMRIIRDHASLHPNDGFSYDDFAQAYPDACHAGDAHIWIDTRMLMRYLEYRGC